MNEMNFYTLNGEQYEVADKANREAMAKANQEIEKANQEIAKKTSIDDATVTKTETWSSNNIVESLCLPFEATGSIATCCPVRGYPVSVTSQISQPAADKVLLTRCGSNLCSIENGDYTKEAKWTIPNGQIFPEGVYYITGRINSTKPKCLIAFYGPSLVTSGQVTVNSNEEFSIQVRLNKPLRVIWIYAGSNISDSQGVKFALEKFSFSRTEQTYKTYVGQTYTAQLPPDTINLDWSNWRNQTNDGIWHDMVGVKPTITVLDGVNNFYSSTGITMVSGREHPSASTTRLQSQIDDLRKAIISTGGNA